MARSVSAGAGFQKTAIASVLGATGAMFVLGGAALFDRRDSVGAGIQTAGKILVPAAKAAPIAPQRAARTITFEKPVTVMLASSTGKLQDMFRRIGYELEGVRTSGQVPRVFLASLPDDLRKLPRAAQRKVTFIKSTLPLILHVNELIEQERERVVALRDRVDAGGDLTDEEETWLATTADRYGLKRPDFDALLARVDVIPPSLAIAQAAEESGWGTSRFAREGNALFGQRSYRKHRKGMVPKERAEGKKFRVRAFDHLIDGVKAYVHNLNSHFAYDEFRARRAALRAEAEHIDGYALAGSLMRYSERGEAYIETIRLIMRANSLRVFDAARLGDSLGGDADVPDA